MKSIIFFYGLFAAGVIDAAAVGNLDIAANLKRALNSVSQIANEPVDFADASCYLSGGACSLAQRDTLALAEAAANAYKAFDATGEACYATNEPCNLAKRQEIEELEREATEKLAQQASASDQDSIEGENVNDIGRRSADPMRHYCGNNIGEACANKKRSAEPVHHYCGDIVGEACANKKRSAEPSKLPGKHYCGALTGEACANKKRAAEAIAEVLPRGPSIHYCGKNIGESCANKKRSLDDLINLSSHFA